MKISAALLSSMLGLAFANKRSVTDTPMLRDEHYHVDIDVRCKGIDWDHLTVEQEALQAKALTTTFNAIHPDAHLVNIEWYHTLDDGLEKRDGSDESLSLGDYGYGGTYGGEYGCSTCDPDDDAFVHKMAPPKYDAWAAKFEAALKPLSGFEAISQCKISMTASPPTPDNKSKKIEQYHVEIDVRCKGVDWDHLSDSDKQAQADTLEMLYNELHGRSEYVFDLAWEHALTNNKSYLRQGDYGYGGTYGGELGCSTCDPDDDAFLMQPLTASKNKMLVRKFEAAMKQVPAFAEISKCQIKMTQTDSEASVDPLMVNARCDGVDWDDLRYEEKKFSAKALQDTYNELHLGRNSISGLHWEHEIYRAASGNFVQDYGYGGTYGGGYDCPTCDPDDDAMLLLPSLSARAYEKWATLFESRLQEGPYVIFEKAESCIVSMVATNAAYKTEKKKARKQVS